MKLFKNYIYSLLYQILSVVLPFITTPYVSRVLGVNGIGRYTLVNTIANYFILVGLIGINIYGNRQISYVRDNQVELEQTFWDLNAIRTITMGITVLAYILFVFFFLPAEDILLYLVEIFLLFASLIDTSWFFEGLEEFKIIAMRNISIKVIGVFLIFLLVRDSTDILIYAGILSVTTLVGQGFLWKELFKKVSYRKVKWKGVKGYIFDILKLWIPTIAIKIYSSIDKVLLGIITNDVQVGLYTSAQNIVTLVTTITSTLTSVSLPRTANCYKNNNMQELRKIANLSLGMVSLIALPMTLGLIGIRNTLVPWFFGKGYEEVSTLLLVSAWFILTVSWSNIFGNQILLACGKEKIYSIAVVISAVENIILSIVLIYKIQAMGAVIASILAEYTGMIIMLVNVRNIIDIHGWIKLILRYSFISAVMLLLLHFVEALISYSFVATFVQCIVGILFYFSMLLVIKDKNIFLILDYVKKLIRKS